MKPMYPLVPLTLGLILVLAASLIFTLSSIREARVSGLRVPKDEEKEDLP